MRRKYITEIFNLTTNKPSNKAMSGDELRKAISDIFSKDIKEGLTKVEFSNDPQPINIPKRKTREEYIAVSEKNKPWVMKKNPNYKEVKRWQ